MADTAKYRKIFEHLRSEIREGRYPRGRDSAIVAEPDDIAALAPLFRGRKRPDAVICESDYVAAISARDGFFLV